MLLAPVFGEFAFDGGFVAFEVDLDALEIGDGFVKAGELLFDLRDDELWLICWQIAPFASPWMQYFIKYDPSLVLKNVKCPVLALNGSKDLQVPSKVNLEAIKKLVWMAPAVGATTCSWNDSGKASNTRRSI